MAGFRWTIKRKLLALGAGTFLPLLLLLAFWIWLEVGEQIKTAEAELALASEQAASQVELLLDNVTRLLRVLARTRVVQRRQTNRIEELLGEVRAKHPELEGLAAISADGRTFASVPKLAGAPVTMADRPWFKQVMATGKPEVGGFLVSRISGYPVAVVAVPLREGNGPPAGAVSAALSLRRLHNRFQSLPLVPGMTITVVDGEGQVLSHVPESEGWIGRRLPSPAPLPARGALMKKLAWFKGGERVVEVTPVGSTGWRVLAGVHPDSLKSRVWSEVLAFGLPLFGLLAVSSYIGLLIAMRVWRPLRALADAARRLPEEKEHVPIRVDSTDEVGELARAFNAMATQVRDARSRLEQWVAELEALSDAGRLLTSSLELSEVLQRLTELAQARLGADVVRIWLHEAPSGELRLYAHTGVTRTGEKYRRRFGPREGLVGWIMEHREPLVLADCQSDPRLTNREWIEAEGFHSFLGIPISLDDMLVGILACMSREHGRFSPEGVALAELFALPAAVAIRNARLYETAQQRREHAEALREIGLSLITTLDPQQVLDRIAEEARRLTGALFAFIVTPDTPFYRVAAVAGDDRGYRHLLKLSDDPSSPYRQAMTVRAIRNRAPVVCNDLLTDPLLAPWREMIAARGVSALVAVPLLGPEKPLGAIVAYAATPQPHETETINLLVSLSGQAVAAMENSRLYQEIRTKASELEERNVQIEALHVAARALAAEHEADRLLQRIVEAARELLGAGYGALAVLQDTGRIGQLFTAGLAPEARERIGRLPEGRGLLGYVLKQGRQPLRLSDLTTHPAAAGFPPGHPPMRSLLATPIRFRDEIIGALYLTEKPGGFTTADEGLLTTLCADAAVAIENARLVEKLNQALDGLKAAQEELVRGETLRAVGALASGMAHHLNNLLAVVLGQVQLLLERVQKPEIRSALEIVEQTTRDGAEVVRRVQRASRLQPIAKPIPVDLNECAREVLELTRPRWQDEALARGIRIDARLEPGKIPAVAGEPAALSEVLMNLLINAIEALPNGGKITVKTWASDKEVHCSVTDTGVGISDEVRRRTLEPFFTTKGPRSTGLGLSVSHGIIKRHQGELTIESAEGKGTTATIRLPVAPWTS